jgi:homeobox protein ESX1
LTLFVPHVSAPLPPVPTLPLLPPCVMTAPLPPVPPMLMLPPVPGIVPPLPLEPPSPRAWPAGPDEALHAAVARTARMETPARRSVRMIVPIHVQAAVTDHGVADHRQISCRIVAHRR